MTTKVKESQVEVKAKPVHTKKAKKDGNTFEAFLEHERKAFREAIKAIQGLLPEGFREHGRTAFDEMIEGYRTLYNSTLDEVKNAAEKVRRSEKKEVKADEKKEEKEVVN